MYVTLVLLRVSRQEWVSSSAAAAAVAAAEQPKRVHLEHERDQRAGPQLELHAPTAAASIPRQYHPHGHASWCVGRPLFHAMLFYQCVDEWMGVVICQVLACLLWTLCRSRLHLSEPAVTLCRVQNERLGRQRSAEGRQHFPQRGVSVGNVFFALCGAIAATRWHSSL